MPRAGLAAGTVVAAAAEVADEIGYHNLTMGVLAERLGVRPPSLYKHVDGLADVRHRLATLATEQLGEAIRDAMQGTAGPDALYAMATAMRGYVTAHPGRYTATIGATFTGSDDPLLLASTRVLDSLVAVLRGYGIPVAEMDHATRTLRSLLHGFATLQAANAFQWTGDPDESFRWMIAFVDRGLRVRTSAPPG